MRIYFEQRELFYVEVEADTHEEAVQKANWMVDDQSIDFWSEAKETGEIELHWHDEEINSMLQD